MLTKINMLRVQNISCIDVSERGVFKGKTNYFFCQNSIHALTKNPLRGRGSIVFCQPN